MTCALTNSLVELIVLNVGLSAGIINQRLFSMFVVEALVLTFITTPFTVWIYPARVRAGYTGGKLKPTDQERSTAIQHFDGSAGGRLETSKFLVVLQKIEHLAAVMFLTQMLEPPASSSSSSSSKGKRSSTAEDSGDLSIKTVPSHGQPGSDVPAAPEASFTPVHIDALKLIELTGRTFSVMQSAEKDQLLLTDDTLQLYRQFGRLRGLDITPHISIVQTDSFPTAVADYANGLGSQLVIVPWTIPVVGTSTALIDPATSSEKEGLSGTTSTALSTFDAIFGSETTGSPMYSHFLRRVFSESPIDLALFVDRGFGSAGSSNPGAGQHIFLPFFGGLDDRLALRLVVQLCHHSHVSATVVRIAKSDEETSSEEGSGELSEGEKAHQAALQSNQLTINPGVPVSRIWSSSGRCAYLQGYPGTAHRIASETADDLAWAYYTAPAVVPPRPTSLDSALTRVSFYAQSSSTPLAQAFSSAESSARGRGRQWRPLLIVVGRGRRGSPVNVGEEATRWLSERSLNPSIGAELRKTVGDTATALILGGGAPSSASFLILEAKG